jgi:hypothetical protein
MTNIEVVEEKGVPDESGRLLMKPTADSSQPSANGIRG